MTTRFESLNMSSSPYQLYHIDEVILNNYGDEPFVGMPRNFDTMRLISLFQSGGALYPEGNIFLDVTNYADRAVVTLNQKEKPLGIPQLHAKLNNKEERIAAEDTSEKTWEVHEGQIFEIWFGESSKYEDRDDLFGSAHIVWTKPVATTK